MLISKVIFLIAFMVNVHAITRESIENHSICQDYVNRTTCVLSKPITININESNPCLFTCDGKWNQDFTRRLYIQQRSRLDSSNIFASVQSQNFIETFSLPITFEEKGNLFSSLSEVVCPSEGKIHFVLTTNSEKNVSLQMDIRRVEFAITDASVTVMASPVSPWAKFYQWPDGVESIFLSVESKTLADAKICSILHLQQAKCPLTTKLDDIRGSKKGQYQTFLKSGGTTVTKSQFPDGIFIVFLTLPNNDLCLDSEDDHLTRRSKTIVIQAIVQSAPEYAIISYAASFLVVCLITGVWLFALKRQSYRHLSTLLEDYGPLTLGDPNLREPYAFLRVLQVLQLFTNRTRENVPDENAERNSPEPSLGERTDSDESLLTSGITGTQIELLERNLLPSEPMLQFIPITEELNPSFVGWWQSESTYQEIRPSAQVSEMAFSRNILMVAAFSTIPVLSTLKFLMEQSENRLDMCYFNRKCMVHIGRFQDFSKIFSNFAYVIIALALKHFIGYHERLTLAASKVTGMNNIGVCRRYSLFNVLAYEMIMQAAMSALFHMCPNFITIKFDMIFIFAIAITYIGCVWSLRHGDFNEFTYSTFGLISSALFLAECRSFLSRTIFWLIVGTIQLYLVLTISLLLTKFGTFSFNPANMIHLYKKWRSVMRELKELNLTQTPNPLPTIIRIVIGFVINLVVLIIAVTLDYDFYSYLFYVSMANANYYTVYYIFTKKFLQQESGTRHSWLSFLLAVMFAIPSVVFYNLSSTDYNASPAESLNTNSFCMLTVFSAHDFWHFTSAFTLFALFTGILTIDDDLAVRKSTIVPVF